MPLITSLASKVMVLVVVLAAGAGFFIGQKEKTIHSLESRLERYGAQVSVPDSPPQTVPTSADQNLTTQEIEKPAVTASPVSTIVPLPPSAAPASKEEKTPADTVATKTPEIPKPTAVVPDGPFAFDPAWREAIVNLYCPRLYSDSFTSGSGVIIDPRGIILTNAHVGGVFLYYDTPKIQSHIDCRVRTPSAVYRAKLLYLPEQFVDEEVSMIEQGRYIPEENIIYGRHDYALLYITGTYDPHAKLPAAFPYLPLDIESLPLPGSSMYMGGYSASYLGPIAVAYGIPLLVSPVTIDSVGSIKNSSTNDTLVFKGATAGQHGASGGAVIRAGGKLTAIPSFFNEEGMTTGDSILSAITIEYVNRDLKTTTGFSLQEFTARDTPEVLSKMFLSDQAPIFHKKYTDAWAKHNTKGTIHIVPGGY